MTSRLPAVLAAAILAATTTANADNRIHPQCVETPTNRTCFVPHGDAPRPKLQPVPPLAAVTPPATQTPAPSRVLPAAPLPAPSPDYYQPPPPPPYYQPQPQMIPPPPVVVFNVLRLLQMFGSHRW